MANAKIVNTPSQAIPQTGATHGQVTVGSSAAKLSATKAIDSATNHVLVQFNGATARVTFDDSTTPTASVGYRYPTGSSAYWTPQMYNAANCIREASTDVTVEVQALNYL